MWTLMRIAQSVFENKKNKENTKKQTNVNKKNKKNKLPKNKPGEQEGHRARLEDMENKIRVDSILRTSAEKT